MDQILLFISEWIGAVAVAMIAGNSMKFQRVKLVFKYPRREGIVALGVFVMVIMLAMILGPIPTASLTGLPNELSSRLLVAVGGVVPVVVALWRRKQPVRSAGWGREKLSPAFQLGLALIFLTIFLRGKFGVVVTSLGESGVLAMLAYSLVVVALEETVFRGYIQLRLAAWWGETTGWLAAAGLFVLCQLPRLLAAPEQLALNLTFVVVQSLAAGFIMQRSSHTLAPTLYRAVSGWLLFF